MNIAIVTPTYNEIGNIEKLLRRIQGVSVSHENHKFTTFVIDDSSPDGTSDLVKQLVPKLKTNNFTIELIIRKEKDGLGRAYIYGFKKVLENHERFDYILQMDADLSHNPAYITGFIHQANLGADFIVASRYMPGGGTPDWPWYRQALSRGGNTYTRLILGSKMTDYTGGFNMYKTSLVKKMNLDSISASGYGFLIELKYSALKHASSFAQIPIVFMDRQHGSSKIPKSTLLKNLYLVIKIRLRA
jgi:dolichol-phosphate mannosyltransferase